MKGNGLAATVFIVFFSAVPIAAGSGGTAHLARGVELFRAGRFDEALAEFNAEVGVNERCPLAYYYAARIRFGRGQYRRALTNLRAALRDSADFADAAGFLAFVLKRTGKDEEAAREWRRFVRLAGQPDGGTAVPADSVMLPEEYRAALEAARAERRKEEAAASAGEPALTGRVAASTADSTAAPDSSGVSSAAVSAPSAADTASGAGGYDDIDRRIESEIRKGIYGIAAVAVLLSGGTLGVVLWWRRRNAGNSERLFSEEVARLLESADEEGLFEDDEERMLREFRERRAGIAGTSGGPPPGGGTVPAAEPAPSPEGDAVPGDTGDSPPGNPEETAGGSLSAIINELFDQPLSLMRKEMMEAAEKPPPRTDERRPITEEIKALVTRMHREGHGIEEICRAADLTRTEVELIIAVRAKHVERLIEEASEEDDPLDHDGLYRAISELKAGGDTPREIARKLGISMSEINFALAVMEERKGRGRSA